MTFQVLPNYFKKIGITIFVLAAFPSFRKGYIDGYNAARGISSSGNFQEFTFLGLQITEQYYSILAVIGLLGLLLYVLSRDKVMDKVMDEFMRKMRLESIRATFFISVIVIFLAIVINPDVSINGQLVLEGQMLLFLIINKVKKLWNRPPDKDLP